MSQWESFFAGARRAPQWLAASSVGFLVAIGAGVALDGACSPANGGSDASVDAPVCNPDSGDLAGCPCDPGTDKPSTCYTGPPGTNGKGFCQTGTRTCLPGGTFSACEGEITPQPEVCNYADDDCDGIIDDLPEITDAAVIAKCNSPACSASGYADAAITCWGPDPGICGAGVKSCAPGPAAGTPTGCNEFIHTPAQEVCNGIDDDCNGKIDDGLDQEGPCDVPDGATWPPDANPLEAGPDGAVENRVMGECLHGQLACVPTGCTEHGCADAGDQCFPSQPAYQESCNGKDDDCNGIIDDKACANSPSTYVYCCVYGTNTTGYCTSSYLGDGGGGGYNCRYAK
jgi:hypothetical protein